MSDIGMTVGLIKALGSPDPAVIEGAVSDWLDDHPEATTTVEDGAISYAKLDSSLQGTVDDVGDLKTQMEDLRDYAYDISPVVTVGPTVMPLINDAAPLNASDIVFDFAPFQDGSGVPSPSNIRPIYGRQQMYYYIISKQLLEVAPHADEQLDGAILKFYNGNIFKLVGTMNKTMVVNDILLDQEAKVTTAKNYSVCVKYSGYLKGPIGIQMQYKDGTVSTHMFSGKYSGEGAIFSGNAFHYDNDNAIVSFKIGIGSGSSDSTFEIYLFEVPDTSLYGKELDFSEYEIDPIFGGYFDLLNGRIVRTWGNIPAYNGETLPGKWISDRDVYEVGSTPTVGAQVVYEMSTPVEYQIEPTSLRLYSGTNAIYCLGCTTSITYHQDPSILLNNLMQPNESDKIASTNYAIGEFFMANGTLYRATASITTGAEIIPGVNCIETTVAEQLTNLYNQLN